VACLIKTPRKNEEAKARYRAVKIRPQRQENKETYIKPFVRLQKPASSENSSTPPHPLKVARISSRVNVTLQECFVECKLQ
jgi:hypothetical protein